MAHAEGELLFQRLLLAAGEDAERDLYFDEDSATWDLEGLRSDLQLYEARHAPPAPPLPSLTGQHAPTTTPGAASAAIPPPHPAITSPPPPTTATQQPRPPLTSPPPATTATQQPRPPLTSPPPAAAAPQHPLTSPPPPSTAPPPRPPLTTPSTQIGGQPPSAAPLRVTETVEADDFNAMLQAASPLPGAGGSMAFEGASHGARHSLGSVSSIDSWQTVGVGMASPAYDGASLTSPPSAGPRGEAEGAAEEEGAPRRGQGGWLVDLVEWVNSKTSGLSGGGGGGGGEAAVEAPQYVYNEEIKAWIPAHMTPAQFLEEERRQQEAEAAPPPPPPGGAAPPPPSRGSPADPLPAAAAEASAGAGRGGGFRAGRGRGVSVADHYKVQAAAMGL